MRYQNRTKSAGAPKGGKIVTQDVGGAALESTAASEPGLPSAETQTLSVALARMRTEIEATESSWLGRTTRKVRTPLTSLVHRAGGDGTSLPRGELQEVAFGSKSNSRPPSCGNGRKSPGRTSMSHCRSVWLTSPPPASRSSTCHPKNLRRVEHESVGARAEPCRSRPRVRRGPLTVEVK